MSSNVKVQPQGGFVETPYIKDLVTRALAYLQAGFAVHFCGPAGTGKTTLALHVAQKLGRPVALTYGNSDFNPTDLIGGIYGYKERKVIDNFIHSVLKTEEEMTFRWTDAALTEACRKGYTLVYDEFTRSRPETNNVLLGVLEEKLLQLPPVKIGDTWLKVHPDFRAIFTSNPEEYAGVYRSQDALRDRMITINLDHFDEETEIAVTAAKSGLPLEDARRVVKIVRDYRTKKEYEYVPTVRASIAIAKVTRLQGLKPNNSDPFFRQICLDILTSQSNRAVTN
ncbi:gas vesicle protein GvpN [Calderihabitans maritimus]|uniref:Gas vesicle protein GvpN n=1 Tax=Calderihabitans maritimus TaxID=1246530 RepID=A0A1Z5HWR1_9FIRM|nr:gas vesicle protein GvpN [Calderihabitans maritimus]GAW93966.1 gas vesicle protein GvpN [Calderihabitans maritimus]